MSKFEKGNIVKLKSGGPNMTVEGFKWDPFSGEYKTESVQCTWFKNDERVSEYFNENALEKVE